MNSAKELFDRLSSFRQADASMSSSSELLIEYCTEVLGSVERLHVDFKEKSDCKHGRPEEDDKRNLAKAVSGFANSGGGVLIWGVEDETLSPKPIANVQQFLTAILQLASSVTDPVVSGIDGTWIPYGRKHVQDGFALIYIPESTLPPHRVILNIKDIKNQYYTRSGESFIVATHTQLEDMFGRRPKPELCLSTKIALHGRGGEDYHAIVVLGLENRGRGPARSPMLCVRILPPYHIDQYGLDGNGRFGLKEWVRPVGSDERKYGSSADTVIHSGTIHDITAVEMKGRKAQMAAGFADLIIDYKIAAEGIGLIQGTKTLSAPDILAELRRLDQ